MPRTMTFHPKNMLPGLQGGKTRRWKQRFAGGALYVGHRTIGESQGVRTTVAAYPFEQLRSNHLGGKCWSMENYCWLMVNSLQRWSTNNMNGGHVFCLEIRWPAAQALRPVFLTASFFWSRISISQLGHTGSASAFLPNLIILPYHSEFLHSQAPFDFDRHGQQAPTTTAVRIVFFIQRPRLMTNPHESSIEWLWQQSSNGNSTEWF